MPCSLKLYYCVDRLGSLGPPLRNLSFFTWITAFSDSLVTRFLQRLDVVQDYVTTYQKRLAAAHSRIVAELESQKIPFKAADAGLFVLVDLSNWLDCFDGPRDARGEALNNSNDEPASREIQLCWRLVDWGVFMNPGQVRQSSSFKHARDTLP